MKRSRKVLLTLLIPAMAGFGCDQQQPPRTIRWLNEGGDVNGIIADCDQPGAPDKPKCQKQEAGAHVNGGGGNGGNHHTNTVFVRSPGPVGGTTSQPTSGIARGGFGGTGAHLSGGS